MRGAALTLLVASSVARAERVIDRSSFWDSSGSRIYSDVVVEKDDGTLETVRVPGGVVDGIGMVQWHSRVGTGTTSMPLLLGFVPSRTRSGTPLRWASSCVIVTPDARGTTDIAGSREYEVMDACMTQWEQMTSGCGYLHFVRGSPQRLEVGYDGVNLIKFREEEWCAPPRDACEQKTCYDSAAAGVTTVFFIDRMGDADDGTILDADVELNAVNFGIWDQGQTLGEAIQPADLANTLTHELGHLVGLDHNCTENPDRPAIDEDGNVAPTCDRAIAPPEIFDATMYAYQDPPENGTPETKKATLETDDINAFCAAYPIGSDPGVCQAAILKPGFIGGCTCKPCAVAGGARGAPAGELLLAIAAVLALRRRRA